MKDPTKNWLAKEVRTTPDVILGLEMGFSTDL